MQTTIEVESTLTLFVETCCNCGTPFGIENSLRDHLLENGNLFYCPNGHAQHYTKRETLEKKIKQLENNLKSETERAEWWKGEAEDKAQQLKVTRCKLTKTQKRVSNGICPCCNRQFVQLTRHMKSKHPEYVEEAHNQ